MTRTLLVLALWVAMHTISPPSHAVEFALFGDVVLTDSSAEQANSQFVLGGLDFYATTEIDDKSRVFIEYVFENTDDGLVTDLERLWISREVRDDLTLAAGRFHTPLGHWNRTYHHGSFMQDTISRPFFLDFEDGAAGVLPVHIVGLMAWGTRYYSWGNVSYEAFVANGSSIDTDEFGFTASIEEKPEIEINAGGDVNSNKALGLRVTAALEEHFAASVFVYDGAIAESGEGINSGAAQGDDLLDQVIMGIDLRAEKNNFDLLAEFYRYENDAHVADNKLHTGIAYYVQLGWQPLKDLKVLIRHENLDVSTNDSYFQLLGAEDEQRDLLALRYDLSDTNSLKFEISRRSPRVGPSEKTFSLQWSFIIP